MVGNYIDVLVVSIGTAAPTWQGRTAACSGLAYEHHGDLACHGACLFNMAEDWREQSPCLCSGSMRGGKRGGARRSVCRHIGVRVEPSAGRRGRGSDGRTIASRLIVFFGAMLRNARVLTLMGINRALDRLGVGAFIPRTLAAHVAAGCIHLDREPETAALFLSPGVRSTCRSSGPPCSTRWSGWRSGSSAAPRSPRR